jgi:hypothetical protein
MPAKASLFFLYTIFNNTAVNLLTVRKSDLYKFSLLKIRVKILTVKNKYRQLITIHANVNKLKNIVLRNDHCLPNLAITRFIYRWSFNLIIING